MKIHDDSACASSERNQLISHSNVDSVDNVDKIQTYAKDSDAFQIEDSDEVLHEVGTEN